ncbi:MAG: arsenate reductase ArsC [Deltaproteobacteria bacterium]|nr:arsenate reductase ArsC [Deltaproteobacteria bacterium]
MAIQVVILAYPGCAHAAPTERLVRQVATDLDVAVDLQRTAVTTPQQALAARFAGSPSVLVDDRDLELDAQPTAELSDRRYGSGTGVPPRWLVEAALLRALQPRSVLFLCYANSVRSQLAEALARRLLPPTVRVQSAGTLSCYVHPTALQVLEEIDIDASDQWSKSVDEIEGASVEVVITLCDEQTCPAFLGHARRVHWPIPDPSAAVDPLAALEAFRACRDEIEQRVRLLAPR